MGTFRMNKESLHFKQHFLNHVTNAFVILLGVILLSWVFTYLIPQGSYERIVDAETGMIRVVSDSYTQIDSSNPSFLDFLVSIPKGIAERAELIVLILLIGGCL